MLLCIFLLFFFFCFFCISVCSSCSCVAFYNYCSTESVFNILDALSLSGYQRSTMFLPPLLLLGSSPFFSLMSSRFSWKYVKCWVTILYFRCTDPLWRSKVYANHDPHPSSSPSLLLFNVHFRACVYSMAQWCTPNFRCTNRIAIHRFTMLLYALLLLSLLPALFFVYVVAIFFKIC